jgi:hypothetical protein
MTYFEVGTLVESIIFCENFDWIYHLMIQELGTSFESKPCHW